MDKLRAPHRFDFNGSFLRPDIISRIKEDAQYIPLDRLTVKIKKSRNCEVLVYSDIKSEMRKKPN